MATPPLWVQIFFGGVSVFGVVTTVAIAYYRGCKRGKKRIDQLRKQHERQNADKAVESIHELAREQYKRQDADKAEDMIDLYELAELAGGATEDESHNEVELETENSNFNQNNRCTNAQ